MTERTPKPEVDRATKDRIVWIDCEMTGLRLGTDKLIEVAVNTHPGIDRYRYAMSLKLEGRHEAIAEMRV